MIESLEPLYDKIKLLKDYKPSKKVNALFWELCNFCTNNNNLDQDIKIDENIYNLNKICAKAEVEMEKYYSKNIKNISDLQNFIYYNNYELLSELEYLNLNFFLKNNFKNILFIWWWSLPLTSIILALKYGISSHIIDIDSDSIELSKNLIKNLWLEEKITIKLWDAKTYVDDKKYDVVYIASLVFLDDNKKLLSNISNIDSKLFLTRSSHWLRQILYKKIDEKIINKYFNIKLVIHPKNEIINSILILTKK